MSATAEWLGEGCAESCLLGPVSNLTAAFGLRLGDIDFLPKRDPWGVWEAVDRVDAGLGNLSGRGNSGPLSFFRLFNLKNVVVVEMVWVVVVLA